MQRIYPGMKVSEARAVCADIVFREYDERLYARLQTEIVQHLVLASPQVSGLEFGIFLLDASGLTHLGGEGKFCRLVQRLINTSGFADLRIGVADTAFAAQVASKCKRSRHCIVPPGKDSEFLSALSLHHMPVSAEMQETLHGLGIKTIGQLLQIPPQEMQERFGREGMLALDLASGIDNTHPNTVQSEEVYESSVDLSFPVQSLDQTQFILKSMLERLCSELKDNDLVAEELLVSFFSDNEKFDERPLKLMRPSNNCKFLLEIIKLSLEASPLAREYTGMNIRVRQSGNENWQQNKMRVVEPHQPKLLQINTALRKGESLQTLNERSQNYASTTFVAESNNNDTQSEPFILLIQRFVTRLGAKSVVRSVAEDQHIPEAAARFLPLAEGADSVLPINFTSACTDSSPLACGLILRRSPNPEPVLVEYQGKTPTSVTYQGRWHRIKELTEPERLSGLWWENPVRKSYYVALIEACDGRADNYSYLVLLVHDHNTNSWQVDGFFD